MSFCMPAKQLCDKIASMTWLQGRESEEKIDQLREMDSALSEPPVMDAQMMLFFVGGDLSLESTHGYRVKILGDFVYFHVGSCFVGAWKS